MPFGGPGPAGCVSRALDAGGSRCTCRPRATARDTAPIAAKASAVRPAPTAATSAAMAATRSPSPRMSAAAPNVPIRLSFMMSRRRSRVMPPKLSAESARPSSWKAPVMMTAAATPSRAAITGGRTSDAASTTAPASPPSTSPASGTTRIRRVKSGSPWGSASPGRAGSGNREKKAQRNDGVAPEGWIVHGEWHSQCGASPPDGLCADALSWYRSAPIVFRKPSMPSPSHSPTGWPSLRRHPRPLDAHARAG